MEVYFNDSASVRSNQSSSDLESVYNEQCMSVQDKKTKEKERNKLAAFVSRRNKKIKEANVANQEKILTEKNTMLKNKTKEKYEKKNLLNFLINYKKKYESYPNEEVLNKFKNSIKLTEKSVEKQSVAVAESNEHTNAEVVSLSSDLMQTRNFEPSANFPSSAVPIDLISAQEKVSVESNFEYQSNDSQIVFPNNQITTYSIANESNSLIICSTSYLELVDATNLANDRSMEINHTSISNQMPIQEVYSNSLDTNANKQVNFSEFVPIDDNELFDLSCFSSQELEKVNNEINSLNLNCEDMNFESPLGSITEENHVMDLEPSSSIESDTFQNYGIENTRLKDLLLNSAEIRNEPDPGTNLNLNSILSRQYSINNIEIGNEAFIFNSVDLDQYQELFLNLQS